MDITTKQKKRKEKNIRDMRLLKGFSGYEGFYIWGTLLGIPLGLRIPCVFLGLHISAVGILYFLFWDYGSVDFTTE